MTSRATGPLHLQLTTQDVQLIVFAGVQLLGVVYQDLSLHQSCVFVMNACN